MRAFRIDVGGVTEIDADLADILTKDHTWDCVGFDDVHDVWVHDEGLARAGIRFANIGGRRNLPLPAYLLGVDGERSVACTLDLEDVKARVQIHPPADQLTIPAIGLDARQDEFGVLQPWRALLAFPGACRHATEHLFRLPEGRSYRQPTACPRLGNLFELPSSLEEQASRIVEVVRERGFQAVTMATDHKGGPLHQLLAANGFAIDFQDVHFDADGFCDDPFYLQGEAGHEVAHLAKPELRMAALRRAAKLADRR